MPGRDRTGPLGRGAMSGRGLGVCLEAKYDCYGAGPRLGLGLGRRPAKLYPQNKEMLQAQKELLENRLDLINRQLESL